MNELFQYEIALTSFKKALASRKPWLLALTPSRNSPKLRFRFDGFLLFLFQINSKHYVTSPQALPRHKGISPKRVHSRTISILFYFSFWYPWWYRKCSSRHFRSSLYNTVSYSKYIYNNSSDDHIILLSISFYTEMPAKAT